MTRIEYESFSKDVKVLIDMLKRMNPLELQPACSQVKQNESFTLASTKQNHSLLLKSQGTICWNPPPKYLLMVDDELDQELDQTVVWSIGNVAPNCESQPQKYLPQSEESLNKILFRTYNTESTAFENLETIDLDIIYKTMHRCKVVERYYKKFENTFPKYNPYRMRNPALRKRQLAIQSNYFAHFLHAHNKFAKQYQSLFSG